MPITSYCLLVPAPTHVSVTSRMAVYHLGKAAMLKTCLSFPIGMPSYRAGIDIAHTGNRACCITGVLRMLAERMSEWILVTHGTFMCSSLANFISFHQAFLKFNMLALGVFDFFLRDVISKVIQMSNAFLKISNKSSCLNILNSSKFFFNKKNSLNCPIRKGC